MPDVNHNPLKNFDFKFEKHQLNAELFFFLHIILITFCSFYYPLHIHTIYYLGKYYIIYYSFILFRIQTPTGKILHNVYIIYN